MTGHSCGPSDRPWTEAGRPKPNGFEHAEVALLLGAALQLETSVAIAWFQRLKMNRFQLSQLCFQFQVAALLVGGVRGVEHLEALRAKYPAVLWDAKGGRCNLKGVEPRVESAWFHRLKLEYDELLSSFAFNFNLRAPTPRVWGRQVLAYIARHVIDPPTRISNPRFLT
jgi:hypothetical protein